jgi:transposase
MVKRLIAGAASLATLGCVALAASPAQALTVLVSAYWMLKRDEPYHDLGVDWHTRRNDQAHTRRLVAQLERLGHTVIIDPAA